MKMKNLLAAILLALIFILAACNNAGDNKTNTGSTNTNDNNNFGNSTRDPAYQYGGERYDFRGEEFIILYVDLWPGPEVAEETGDAVNDAKYMRRIETEEFFNVVIKQTGVSDIDALPKAVVNDVLGGLNSYDIALPHKLTAAALVTQGVLYNWDKMPNVDFSKKYWNQSILKFVDIKGYIPYVSNDYSISAPSLVYFNKDLVAEYSLDSPYDFVKDGKWTIDKLTELAKQVSKDLDGDGLYTEADLYGFASLVNYHFINAMYGCGVTVGQWNDGRYVISTDISRVQSMVEKYYDLLYNGNQSFGWTYQQHQDRGDDLLRFDSGRALFHLNADTTALRAADFNFGFLPYPKLDEYQETYLSISWAQTICTPLNIRNPEKVGTVVEFFGAKGNELVLPAYNEILLKGKVLRDNESGEILEMLHGTMIYDFGFDFGAVNNLNYLLPTMLEQKTTNVASWFEKNSSMVQALYDGIVDAALDNARWQ